MKPTQRRCAVAELPVPDEHRDAAEEICRHLVTLRGGGLFLSSSDALLLLQWLEEGVPVSNVLCALERAEIGRRDRQSRRPLSLSAAKRHLGKRAKPFKVPTADPDSPFDPVVALLRATGEPEAAVLATALGRLPPVSGTPDAPEETVRQATSLVRDFFVYAWAALAPDDRQHLFDSAAADYADLSSVDASILQPAIEERAHSQHRARYPYLTVATFWQLVDPT